MGYKKNIGIKELLLLGTQAMLYATGPIGFVFLVKLGFDPWFAVAYFLIFGGVVILVIGRYTSTKEDNEHELYTLTHRYTLGWLIALSFVTPLTYLSFIYAMTLGSIVDTSVLTRLYPLIVLGFSIRYLGEKILSWSVVSIAYVLMLVGVYVMTFAGASEFTPVLLLAWALGVNVALMKAFEYLFMIKLERHTRLKIEDILGYTMILPGSILLLVLWSMNIETDVVRFPGLSEFLVLVYLGFATIALPHMVGIKLAQATNRPSFIAAASFFVVIFTAPMALYFHGEAVNWVKLMIAISLIGVGIFLLKRGTKEAE